jgi:3-oxoacyl-[acyl-carrier-protein] synthase III
VRSRIVGTGRGIPEKVLTNSDLEKMVDTSDTWIVERTGIRERRILDKSKATSDLATEAGLKACQAAGIEPASIDCIIVGTVTPDHPFPATAVYVQKKLGARAGGAAFDLSAACAGFLYAMATADGFIGRGMFKRVLIVGVEILSRIVDWKDRNTAVLFGDGAGAAVLVAEPESEGRGILSTHLHADGNFADILNIKAGGTRVPITPERLDAREHLVHMNGREVYKHAVRNMASASAAALAANGLHADQVSTVFAHQANIRIIEGVAERVGIPMDRFFLNISRYGNTSSATLPISLDEALEQGRVKAGDLLLFTALGGGLAWGSAVMRW